MEEFEPVKKEREFYKQCMRYGDEQAALTRGHLRFLGIMYDNLSSKWEIIDRHLYRGGFGYAFFNIRIISDPRYRDQNIILLEPPTFDHFTEVYETLKVVKLFSKKFKEPKKDIEFLLHYYVDSDRPKHVQRLIESVIQAIFESTTHFVDNGSKVTTINNWRSDFNKRYERSNVTDWEYKLSGNTALLVKNEMYFSKLFDILFETPNEVIITSIVMKAIAENLKYINWNLATKIKVMSSRHRSEFCLHSTKLYGISYGILKEFDYDVKESYLGNILQFRKIMKQKELANLKPELGESDEVNLPFSIIDLARPANRFAINVYFPSLKFNHKLKIQYLEAMSNTYGLRIVHKALQPSINSVRLFPENGLNHMRQFFHLEYVKV
ncbi:hypothetical protein TSAR_015320 [Trichomalopsis sarcophagae]|uniref:Uncharacterized protein n=1 Tax=Trichomalopsis sarcophagae TaxID=543379 RepID=A0A232ERW4_9HYME|nr:hypothetical protein TSAR_015320 [Trichomalopsis sarcophagae]